MKIQCHNCTKTYLVSREQIGESGRKVKCTNCNHMWHEYLKEMSSELCPANMQEKKASWRQNLALAFATVAGLCVIIVGGIFPGEVSKIYKAVSSYKDSISYKLYQNPLLTEQIRNITNSFNSSTGNIDNKITQNIFK